MAAPFVYLCVQWVHCVFELSGSTGSAMQAIRGEHNGLYHVLSGVLNKGFVPVPKWSGAKQMGPSKGFFSCGFRQRCGMETSLVCASWACCPKADIYVHRLAA